MWLSRRDEKSRLFPWLFFLYLQTKGLPFWAFTSFCKFCFRSERLRQLLRSVWGKETPINFLIYHDIQHNYTIYIKIEEHQRETFLVKFPSPFFWGAFCSWFLRPRRDARAVGARALTGRAATKLNGGLALFLRPSLSRRITWSQEVRLTGLKYYITHTIAAPKSNNSTVNIDRAMHLNSAFFCCPFSLFCKKESITSHKMPGH